MSNIMIRNKFNFEHPYNIYYQMEDFLDTSKIKFSKPFDELRDSPGRSVCPLCGNKRRYYCYDCIVPINHTPPKPDFSLPVKIHIVRHVSEKVSKSSIIPLKMVYPSDVFLYTFTQPDRFDPKVSEGSIDPPLPIFCPEKAVILYPSKESVTVREMDPKLWEGVVENKSGSRAITDVFVIDSTWSTATQVISKSSIFKEIKKHVKLGSDSKTIFWRHQKIGRECLATCEAIYVMLREIFASAPPKDEYDNRYDDVLFYYLHIHGLVQDNYRDSKKHRGHLPNYAIRN